MSTKKKVLLVLGSIAIPLGFLLISTGPLMFWGCVPPQQLARPVPTYSDLYKFPKYAIPEGKKAGSVDVTTIIAVPEYKDTTNQEYAGGARVMARGGMTPDMVKVFKSFAGTIGEDVEAQMVAKGMTTKGPYYFDEMTYPDKKGADMIVQLNFVFDIQPPDEPKFVKTEEFLSGGVSRLGKVYESSMSVGATVFYYMYEPMSGEKMWIKKIDLGVNSYPFQYAVEMEQYVAQQDGCGGVRYAYRDTNKVIFDERPKVLSDILKEASPKLMKNAWTYFDTDEMLNLKAKSQEIRERKRY